MDESGQDFLEDLLLGLCDAGVEFIVGGGLAFVIQGGERLTMDVDISVDRSPDNVERLLEALKTMGLAPRAPVPAEALKDEAAIARLVHQKNALVFTFWDADNPFRVLDIFLTAELSYEQLLSKSQVLDLKGRRLRVLTRRALLELKERIQPPREKDLHDIAVLKRLLESDESGT